MGLSAPEPYLRDRRDLYAHNAGRDAKHLGLGIEHIALGEQFCCGGSEE